LFAHEEWNKFVEIIKIAGLGLGPTICLNLALAPYLHNTVITLLHTCALRKTDNVLLYAISCLDLFINNNYCNFNYLFTIFRLLTVIRFVLRSS